MPQKFAERILAVTTSTGTGAYTIGAAVSGYLRPADVPGIGTGDTLDLYIEAVNANGVPTGLWEAGTYTLQANGTWARTSIAASSNAGAAVNWPAGSKRIAGTLTAKRLKALVEGLATAQADIVELESQVDAIAGAVSGSSTSRAMRIAQQLLHRANFTMGNNAFTKGFSTSGGTVTPQAAVPAGYDRSYPASVNQAPMSFYGAQIDMEGFGVRPSTSQWTAEERHGNVAWAEFGVYGDSFVIELEKGYPYRVMVEEDGVDRYLPDAQIMNEAGSGPQLYLVSFGTRARRIITIECNRGGDSKVGRVGALYVKTVDAAAFIVPRKTPKICFFSDSAMQGEPPWGGGAGLGSVMSHCLGIKDALISTNHSTGVAGSLGGLPGLRWGLRRSDWQNFAPDVMVFRTSAADPVFGDAATLVPMHMAEVNAVRVALPNCIIMLIGMVEYPVGSPFFDQKRIDINAAQRAAIEELNDPFIKWIDHGAMPLDYWEEVGTGNQGAPGNDGPRSLMVRADEHWSREGDLMAGLSLVEHLRSAIEEMAFGADLGTPGGTASITPAAATLSLTAGQAVNTLLGTVVNGAPTSVLLGDAPAGTNFVLSGQQLRLEGTPTTEDADISTVITVGTNNGNVTFNLSGSVAAASAATITPTSGNHVLAVGVAANLLLGTISFGTPSIINSGVAPAGCNFTLSGQQLRLTGTPTTVSASIATTVVVATDNGNVSFDLTGSVEEGVAASISPTTSNQALTVGTAVDALLGTIANGVPSSVTGGTAPPGTNFVLSGQDLRLSGTPTTVDADIATTITVATDNGDVNYNLTGSVAAAGSGPSDPFWANVTLMAAVQGGALVDLKGRHTFDMNPTGTSAPATISGDAVVFNGSHGVKVLGDQADFAFAADEDLCIEIWASMPNSFTSTGLLFDAYANASAGSYQMYATRDGSGNGVGVYSSNASFQGERKDAAFGFMRDDSVVKYALVRVRPGGPGTLVWTQLFANDVFIFEKAGDAVLTVGAGGLCIGYQSEALSSFLVGAVKGMRVTKGNKRYVMGNVGEPSGDPTITSDTFEQALAMSL